MARLFDLGVTDSSPRARGLQADAGLFRAELPQIRGAQMARPTNWQTAQGPAVAAVASAAPFSGIGGPLQLCDKLAHRRPVDIRARHHRRDYR